MKCCPRKNYNYEYVHYNGENIKELQELADPVKVSQTETGAVIHLIERGHYNLCPEIGDFIVKKSCGEEISFELFNEDDFKDNFMDDYQLKERYLSEELLDLIEDVIDDASSEICQDAYGKKSPCDSCCYEEGYCDYDENGKAFFHRTDTCAIRKLRQKLKEIEGE